MYNFYCRLYQTVFKLVAIILPWRKPELLTGKNCLTNLPDLIKSKKISNVLIVTDKGIISLGLINELLKGLDRIYIKYTIYDKTVPNPTIENIEAALVMYHENKCEAIIGFGGGSAIDCSKGVGARVARPTKTIASMKGILKVRKAIPTLFAVPTTAGTGSEGTLAAVVTNNITHEKYAINDMALIPHYAILDPNLTLSLPQHITSTTGMDALTHAIEAYIGRSNTKETKDYSIKAVKMVFNYLEEAYANGHNIEARENMLMASYYAGIAFTRAYVGNVHAIAHTLGGFYAIAHGLANAVILPYVLEFYGKSIHKSLAELADLVGIGANLDSKAIKARKFINEIKNMNQRMNIPQKIIGIKEGDIPIMIEKAFREANPLYPVPRILSRGDFNELFHLIQYDDM